VRTWRLRLILHSSWINVSRVAKVGRFVPEDVIGLVRYFDNSQLSYRSVL
jgi:hypothetical protein